MVASARSVGEINALAKSGSVAAAKTDTERHPESIDAVLDPFMPRTELVAALTLETGPDAAYGSRSKSAPDQRVDCGRTFFACAAGQLVGFGAAQLIAAELSTLSDSLG